MKHYSRKCQHSQARIAELEERKVTCEVGLAAMSACWQQLVDTLRSLVGSDEESATIDEIRDLYNISTCVSDKSMLELRSSLERTQQATTQVVSKLLLKSGGAASGDQCGINVMLNVGKHRLRYDHTLSERDAKIAKLKEELQQATQSNKSAEEALKRETNQEINDLKNILAQRDTNLARIRENRDQQGAELHERKVKESARISSCEENKALAASRAERITVLNSQLRRYRLQLAAQSNSEDIVLLLLNNPNNDVTVVEKLRARLSAANNRLAALERACLKLDEEHPNITRHIQAESDALQKLSDVSKELENQLKQKDDELQRLQLLDQQQTLLYTEIEKLSAAWESLDHQVKSVLFDLTSMEEKLSNALTFGDESEGDGTTKGAGGKDSEIAFNFKQYRARVQVRQTEP
ncbi:E3 ubiquitin-protein ligase bre1 [Marasmius sp. AFHP31]|nr:E3 ubiquitin-protein ligase bre1 [Marasmius sp. AFHP31]